MTETKANLDREDCDVVRGILQQLERDLAFDEEESYYHMTSHCRMSESSNWLKDRLKDVAAKTDEALHHPERETYADVCIDMDSLFILAYAASAVYAALHQPDKRWFHEPFWGGYITFKENRCTPLGHAYYHRHPLPEDPLLKHAWQEYARVWELYQAQIMKDDNGCHVGIDEDKERKYRAQLPALHASLMTSLRGIAARVKEKLQ